MRKEECCIQGVEVDIFGGMYTNGGKTIIPSSGERKRKNENKFHKSPSIQNPKDAHTHI